MDPLRLTLIDTAATERLGAALAGICRDRAMIHLRGPLGSGKTTVVRGFLHAAGIDGAIKSPTYTLVEPYRLGERRFYHFDLYRLEGPEALEMLGFRDYLEGDSVCLIEWPEQAGGLLPAPDIRIELAVSGAGRRADLVAETDDGAGMLKSLQFVG